MIETLPQRLERIESHLAHLEHQFDQLNQVVIDQGKLVARLKTQLRRISATVEAVELERIKSTNPRPPHSR